jgi:glycosyltransferase involved in cell wall biosynthesis
MKNQKMKVLLLADANSSHTYKWATSLAQRGVYVYVFTLAESSNSPLNEMENVEIIANTQNTSNGSDWLKIKYVTVINRLKKLLKKINPDILHAHYASSYGLLGALSGYHPFIISIWGSDIYEFPNKSFLHKKIIKYNFKSADFMLSTSRNMISEIAKYTDKKVELTPFGIDLNKFVPKEKKPKSNEIVVGTIKALEKVYGIDILIKAFAQVRIKNPELNLKLLIVGKGSQLESLKNLSKQLNVSDYVNFTGFVDYNAIVQYYHQLDVFVAVSRSESFGVSVIEASACEIPVIVSDVGGLPEVVENEQSGFIVKRESVEQAVEALEKLIKNEELRKSMGKKGRDFVKTFYNWDDNVNQMMEIYENANLKKS